MEKDLVLARPLNTALGSGLPSPIETVGDALILLKNGHWAYRPHWQGIAQFLESALKTGLHDDVLAATEHFAGALSAEGWLAQQHQQGEEKASLGRCARGRSA